MYISQKSKFKSETIEHLIESLHVIKSQHDNIHVLVLGDFNKVDISDLLDSYGQLQNIQVDPTRKDVILDLLLTDLHTSYLPTLTRPPLDVDVDKKGVASDHNIVIFPPAYTMPPTQIKNTKNEIYYYSII